MQTDESFWSLDEDANGNPSLVLDIQKASGSKDMWAGFSTAEGDASLATVTERVYLDVDVAGETSRIEVGLFGAGRRGVRVSARVERAGPSPARVGGEYRCVG